MENFNNLSKEQLSQQRNHLESTYQLFIDQNLTLDMARGKPSKEQLDLSNDMLNINSYISKDNIDLRNYGILDGILEAKELFSSLLDIPSNNIIIGGSSTLNMLYDTITRLYIFGYNGHSPWSTFDKIKILCPVPGYDRHFDIFAKFGFEMIPISMNEQGVDMDTVEHLCKNDESIKGIMCVPLYSNPTGICYSDQTVKRLASMPTASPDFKIFWDNAYALHHVYKKVKLLNIFDTLKLYKTEDRLLYFFSTSKINFPGSGVAILGGSDNTIKHTKEHLSVQTIGYNKINQLKTVLFLKDKKTTLSLMEQHASILKPKFDIMLNTLDTHFKDNPILSYNRPLGGYFVSVDTNPNLAKIVVDMCQKAGLTLTPAGSTYPHMTDPNDTNIRLAPSFPSCEDLNKAMDLFCLCVELATIRTLN